MISRYNSSGKKIMCIYIYIYTIIYIEYYVILYYMNLYDIIYTCIEIICTTIAALILFVIKSMM